MKPVLLLAISAALASSADPGGIRPRPGASDYPAHETRAGITVAAAVIPPEQAARLLATDLKKAGYLLVEVAVYPEPGHDADVHARDFLMQAGKESSTVRPASPDTVVGVVQKPNIPKPPPGPHDITVYPTATIGYESGGYDPVTGRRGGVYTAAGVGVAVGAPPVPPAPKPASTPRDRDTMRQELIDKGLPEGRTGEAVAGYLYFPAPSSSKAKTGPYKLTWYGESGQIQLTVPPPRK